MVFPPVPPPRDVTTRLSMILGGLIANVTGRSHLLGLLHSAITGHLCRIGYRFRALAEQVRAGKVPAERPRKPRTAAAADAERMARPVPEPRVPRLPRRFRWLAALVPETFGYSGQLLHLLDDPEMVALVSASPGLRRLFRSMCRMLGIVDVPPLIRLPPRVRRARVPDAAEGTPPPRPAPRPAPHRAPRRARRRRSLPDGLLGIAPQSAWSFPDFAVAARRGGGGFSSA